MHRAKILSTVMMLLLTSIILLSGCGKRDALSVNGYTIENNQRDNKATYPYVLRTDSSTWYLSGEDISLLGEEDYYAGLAEILNDLEQDFSDARDALTGYIQEEIPPVDIYTDFSGRAGISEVAGAYYNERSNFIKLFSGWDMAKESLLHEYVHYLTMHCSEAPRQRASGRKASLNTYLKLYVRTVCFEALIWGYLRKRPCFTKSMAHGMRKKSV